MENKTADFFAGFGMTDITPQDSVPMASYGDDLRRFSEGRFTPLEARALAVTDENGDSLIMITGDLSWAPDFLGCHIRERIEKELGVPQDHVVLSGIHTHASVAANHDHLPEVVRYQELYINGMTEAARRAMADRKPAEVYVGSAISERMNFVRRYIMDDGSLCGDNAYGTGTVISGHESAADPELQMMRIVRQGGRDILMVNFQAHPHLEGKTKMLSYQTVGAFRAQAEDRFGVHCMYWNGAAGNINSHSRIKPENRTMDRDEWAKIMVDYAEKAMPSLCRVKTGPIKVAGVTCTARVNHMYDRIVEQALDVQKYFKDGHSAQETAQYAWQFGIHSYYHACRIVANAKAGDSRDIYLFAFSFGDVAGVVVPYEMFDTNGMFIKRNSPFQKTFIVGYSYPAYCGYIPSELGFRNGGYEADNCTYAPGTAEELAGQYLELLKKMHG